MTRTTQKPRDPLVVGLPGTNSPEVERLNLFSSEILAMLDDEIGFNVPGRKRPCSDAQAFRQRVRASLTDAVLYAAAAIHHERLRRD